MKKTSIVLALISLFVLTACEDDHVKTTVSPEQESVSYAIKPSGQVNSANLKLASLDAVYGWRNAFMQSKISGANLEVEKMQSVLNAWPDEQSIAEEPCYMQLKDEVVRILDMTENLPKRDDSGQPDYRFDCRQSINYEYDEARVNAFWQKLE